MSRIYFHSQSGDAEVRGSERAFMGHLINKMFRVSLGINDWDTPENPHVLRRIVYPDHYCLKARGAEFARQLTTALYVAGDTPVLWVDGQVVRTFSAALNTAMVMGSDPIKLCARVHGQCEIHTFVEGKNREWLAKKIDHGRAVGVLRSDQGWEETATLLRSRNDEPVVTSYSVCEQFPNAHAAGWKPDKLTEEGEADWDAWYDLPSAQQWEMGMTALRKTALEMKPSNWNKYYFHDGVTGFDLLAAAIALDKEQAA